MPARATLFKVLSEDATLLSLGVERVYASGSLDSPEEDTFLVLRQETSEPPAYALRAVEHVTVWVHSKGGDYGPVDAILEQVKTVIQGQVHVLGEDGWSLTQADWRGDSPDLVDGGFHTLTRNADFAIVSRRALPLGD